MLKKTIVISLIDVVVIAFWDYWANAINIRPMEAIGIVLIIPILIIVTGIVGLFLRWKKNPWGQPLLINLFLAIALFIGVVKYENWRRQHNNYLEYYFSDNEKIFNVILKLNKAKLKNGLTYNIYERLGELGNAGTDLDGSYTISNDTIYLASDKGEVMKIFEGKLFNYKHKGGIVMLRKKP